MNETIIIYLSTVNLMILGVLYLFSRHLESIKQDLNETASILSEWQEALNKKGEEDSDDGGTGTESTSK